MSAWVVVALLAAFFVGWVGRSVRAAGRQWHLIVESQVWAAEATDAWDENNQLKDRLEHGAGIRVDLGEVEP